jgi:hypothetical protein
VIVAVRRPGGRPGRELGGRAILPMTGLDIRGHIQGASFKKPFRTTADAGRDGTYDLLIPDEGHLLG